MFSIASVVNFTSVMVWKNCGLQSTDSKCGLFSFSTHTVSVVLISLSFYFIVKTYTSVVR